MKYLRIICLFILLVCTGVACFVINKDAKEIDLRIVDISYTTSVPVKAHLKDGGLVVFGSGFSVIRDNDALHLQSNNDGVKYNLTRNEAIPISILDKEEIAFLEIYKTSIDGAALLSGIPASGIGATVLAVAIFGSCPTYYSYDGQSYHLEAEGFSYSITPRFEVEDLDRLHVLRQQNDKVKIQVKNEALETHYIDQLQLVSVDHDSSSHAYSILSNNFLTSKEIVVTKESSPIHSAIAADGQDVLQAIIEKDEHWHRSPMSEIYQLEKNSDHKDWIDIQLEVPEDQREIYLQMHVRNTLINSVFLYDILLSGQNFGAIDWMDKGINNWIGAYQFFNWYNEYFGMSVSILENGEYKEVHHFGDLGPISWSERALPIRLSKGGNIRLRLSYLPDNWHIDWIGVDLQKVLPDNIEEYSLEGVSSMKNFQKEDLIRDDSKYFIQYPGHSTELEVSVLPLKPGLQRSWFIRSKGYYTEWLRNEWLDPGVSERISEPLKLNEELIKELSRKWILKKDDFEALFFKTMIVTQPSES